ncbi:MAG: hypothetical protein R3F34_09140 [Planctomycetota bacterium]
MPAPALAPARPGPPPDASGAASHESSASTRIAASTSGATRWSDLLAPFDLLDGSPVADAAVCVAGTKGELRTYALQDAASPADFAVGCIARIDSPTHFARYFMPSALRERGESNPEATAPLEVALAPCASIEFVLGVDSASVESGTQAQVVPRKVSGRSQTSVPSAGSVMLVMRVDPVFAETATNEQRLSRMKLALVDRGVRRALDLANAGAPSAGDWVAFSFDDGLPTKPRRVPAGVGLDVWCSSRDGSGSSVGLGMDPNGSPDSLSVRLELEPLAKGELRTLALHVRRSAAVRGEFPRSVSERNATLHRHMGGVTWTGPGKLEVDDGGSFEATDLTPGNYHLEATWTDESKDLFLVSRMLEIGEGERIDVGVLEPAAGSRSVEVRPNLTIDGVPSDSAPGISWRLWLGREREDPNDPSPLLDLERTDVLPFAVRGLAPYESFVAITTVTFPGAEEPPYTQLATQGETVKLDLAEGDAVAELPICLASSGTVELRVEFPRSDPKIPYTVRAWVASKEHGRGGLEEFDVRASEDGATWIGTTRITAGTGAWFASVACVPELFALDTDTLPDETELPSYVCVTHVDFVVGHSTCELPVQLAARAVGKRTSFVGEGSNAWPTVGVQGLQWPEHGKWFGGIFERVEEVTIHGLLPNTTYVAETSGLTFTTGAAGTTVRVGE